MKKILRPFINAWRGMTSHKLRSFLTILGIVIGVSAVIALMSIGKGAEANIISRIQTLGSDLMFVQSGAVRSTGGVRSAEGTATALTLEDAKAIEEKIPGISSVAPIYQSSLQLIAGKNNMNTRIAGTTPEYEKTYNLSTTSGTFFSDYDYENGINVAVLGSTVAERLYAGEDPLGQDLRMGSIIVRVIGVLQAKGSVSNSPDSMVIIPLTTMQQTITQQRTTRGEQIISSIAMKVAGEGNIQSTKEEVANLLRTRHRITPGMEDDFSITSLEEVAETVSDTMATTTMLLGAIAAISLLVGGIGVMNIMLVSVLERTREIGIRKALGAQESDIWVQFLIEAAFLTLTGGLIGVALGWGATFLVKNVWSMNTVVSADIIILAVSVSVGIGLVFGFYPAWQASRLNPIEALRHE